MDRSSRDEDIGHDGGLDDQTAVSSSSSIDQPEPSFMFVPSPSRLGKAPSAGHPRVRSFLMRNARRQKAWTTGASGAATATAGAAGAFEDIKNTGGEGGSDSSRARSQEWAVSANEGANPALDSHYYSIPPTQSATSERPRTNSLDQQYDLAQSTMATWFLCPLCLRLTSRVPDAVCWQCSTGLIDPFNSIAVRLDRRTSELLSHYLHAMAPTSVPLDLRSQSPLIRTDWLSSALSNKAFIHSMFCAAAMHMYVLGKASAIDIMHHRAEAVAALSLLLADSNTSLADSNIAAVFSLLCVEESLSSAPYYSPLHAAWEKSTDQRAIHYNGLNRMIALRGGLGSLKTNKCLQSFILWHRTVHAIALCQRADIDLDWVTEQALSPSAHLSHHPGQHNYMAEMCRVIGIEHELLNLVVQLESYAYTVSRWYSKTPSDMCPWALQNAACILECRLLDYLSTISSIAGDSPPRLSPGTPPLQYQRPPSPSSRARIHMLAHTALTTALLTFTICISEPLSRPFYSFHISLISRLRDALQSLSVADFAAAPDVYFWILAVGAFASRGSREDRWFKSTVDGVYDGVRAGHGKIGERGGVEWIVDRAKRCLWVEFVLDMWVKKLVESQSSLR